MALVKYSLIGRDHWIKVSLFFFRKKKIPFEDDKDDCDACPNQGINCHKTGIGNGVKIQQVAEVNGSMEKGCDPDVEMGRPHDHIEDSRIRNQ
jgi:hypothetical protein